MGLTAIFLVLIVNLAVRLVNGGLLWICATSKRKVLDVMAEASLRGLLSALHAVDPVAAFDGTAQRRLRIGKLRIGKRLVRGNQLLDGGGADAGFGRGRCTRLRDATRTDAGEGALGRLSPGDKHGVFEDLRMVCEAGPAPPASPSPILGP
jgi:hypothetical protein